MIVGIFLGTRPEAIKLWPLIEELRSDLRLTVKVICTGQHTSLLYPQLLELGIVAVDHLTYSKTNTLEGDLGSLLLSMRGIKCDLIICQGDTTTALAAAMFGFYNKIPVVHVEAGLRSFNKLEPFPEEGHRVVISRLATYHMCPTERDAQCLMAEGIKDNVYIVGNTGIDAVLRAKALADSTAKSNEILVTCHRRENIQNISRLISYLNNIKRRTALNITWVRHHNPMISSKLISDSIDFIEPLTYMLMIQRCMSARLIITDSGGLQEEATVLRVPTLVIRNQTERADVLITGVCRLVNIDDSFEDLVVAALSSPIVTTNSDVVSPVGDGKSSARIHKIITDIYL